MAQALIINFAAKDFFEATKVGGEIVERAKQIGIAKGYKVPAYPKFSGLIGGHMELKSASNKFRECLLEAATEKGFTEIK